jgi:hypothetical protein
MNNVKEESPIVRSSGRGSAIKAALLGLLSLFEVTFDLLSLVAALLGGVARDADGMGPTRGDGIIPGAMTEASHQLAPHIIEVETPTRRPIGIMIIAILLGLLGILEFGFGALAFVTSVFGGHVIPLHSPAVGAALGVFYVLIGLVKLVIVWGLLELHRWAYWATVFLVAASLLSSLLAITQPAPTIWAFLADLLIPIVILVYLIVDSNVRRAFHI